MTNVSAFSDRWQREYSNFEQKQQMSVKLIKTDFKNHTSQRELLSLRNQKRFHDHQGRI
jgi:hypothetical protein